MNQFRRTIIEGLQPVVQQPQFALRAHELCEPRHGFAKSTQEIASRYSDNEPIDATFCVILRNHVWPCKALEPEGRTVDC